MTWQPGYLALMQAFRMDGPKKDLLDLMKRNGELSLDLAEEKLSLAKTTLRQHLLALEGQGLIQRKYERAGQGRPRVVFELASEGQNLYPTQEPKLLRELLEHLKAAGQQRVIQDFFERYWAQREAGFKELLATKGVNKADFETRLETLRELLEAEGFMPQIELGSKRQFTVRECNCPFREVISATQLPCRLELEFIRRALKSKVNRAGYIPAGDKACTYSGQVK